MADENGAATDTTTGGPLGSPAGQLLQRGMNFLFPAPPKRGMVSAPAPVAAIRPVTPVAAPLTPNIAPPMDLNSPINIMNTADKM